MGKSATDAPQKARRQQLEQAMLSARQAIPDASKVTVKAIQDAIPKHYFEQDTLRSFSYLARDLLQVAVTMAAMVHFGVPLIQSVQAALGASWLATVTGLLFKLVMWNLFWFVQGLNGTALWVLAHECGHRAFSSSRLVNDVVGMVLHSFLLVPFHSWRVSHSNHHKHTNHTELDTVFVPEKLTKGEDAMREAFAEAPLKSLFFIVTTLLLGWPLYLFFNITGQKYSSRANHFEPQSPLYRDNERSGVVQSDIGLLVALCSFYSLVHFNVATWNDLLVWYFVPYLWVNTWLVGITYLQHTDTRLPHYNGDNWTFLRGALCTIDRDFGPVINTWLHHIHDSHIVHHIFSTMPFYNAIQVTRKHLRQTVAKEYCLSDARSIPAMMWDSWRNCRWVVPDEGIAWYKK